MKEPPRLMWIIKGHAFASASTPLKISDPTPTVLPAWSFAGAASIGSTNITETIKTISVPVQI